MYYIDQKRCTFCAGCSSVCPVMAITVRDHDSEIGPSCTHCGNCVAFCPIAAIGDVPQISLELPLLRLRSDGVGGRAAAVERETRVRVPASQA
jgi:ferredoxin